MTPERDEICRRLVKNPTAALRFCAQPDAVAESLTSRILVANELAGKARLTIEDIARLTEADYRLIALAIHACHRGPSPLQDLEAPSAPRPEVSFVKTLEELRHADALTMIVHDAAYEHELDLFLRRCGYAPGAFIEAQLDLPGRNAVFRDGVVKSWRLPCGTSVVSKRDNRRKADGFFIEQRNLNSILKRLDATIEARVPLRGRFSAPCFTVRKPVCIIRDPATTSCYAVWPQRDGETLEELLIRDDLPQDLRRQHLDNYRRSLDILFDHGVVWRDMSPRNIIVERRNGEVYHFVDFEKVEVREGPLDKLSRIEACRTQFCVEEFGVICPEKEVLDTFSGLFVPHEWDVQSDAPLPFVPRPEIAAVLAGRGLDRVSEGLFNRLDQQVWEVRRARFDSCTGRLVRPGLLGFRVEHFLSLSMDIDCSDYDRKTTEVLLAANAEGQLMEAFHCLSTYADQLESAIIVAEFDAILTEGSSRFFRYPEREAQLLCGAIDELYLSRNASAPFALVLERCHERLC